MFSVEFQLVNEGMFCCTRRHSALPLRSHFVRMIKWFLRNGRAFGTLATKILRSIVVCGNLLLGTESKINFVVYDVIILFSLGLRGLEKELKNVNNLEDLLPSKVTC